MSHPMKPTAEQLTEWLSAALTVHPGGKPGLLAGYVAHQAYAAGADDELAECEDISRRRGWDGLRAIRRPPLQTPRERALEALERISAWIAFEDVAIIRQALEGNDG